MISYSLDVSCLESLPTVFYHYPLFISLYLLLCYSALLAHRSSVFAPFSFVWLLTFYDLAMYRC